MRVRHLVFTVGVVLLAFIPAFLLSAGVAWWYGEGSVFAFLASAGVATAIGGTAVLRTRVEGNLSIREGYAVVSLAWLAAGVLGAVPYLFSGVITDPVAAVFESVSGFTTTGASVIADVEGAPRGILFWRSLTQWLGGMGIIVLGVAILPFLGIGGMHLLRAEVSGGGSPERLSPRIGETAKLLWIVYAAMTGTLMLLLWVGGMTLFDAVNHALTTMPTGGFSTRNSSVALDSAFLQYVIILFMYLAGVNFVLHFRALTGKPHAYLRSEEWWFYTGLIAASCLFVLVVVVASGSYAGLGLERAFRDSLFQVVSLGTATGLASSDYELWPLAAQLALVSMMLAGGMVGSTAGGIKSMRLFLLFRQTVVEMRRNLHPRAVVVTRLGGKVLEESDLLKIFEFVLLYLSIFGAGALALSLLGHDLATSISASATSIGNVGPGMGDVGPMDNFGWMDPWTHLVLIGLMIVGRLEIFTVLLLFHPSLWRR